MKPPSLYRKEIYMVFDTLVLVEQLLRENSEKAKQASETKCEELKSLRKSGDFDETVEERLRIEFLELSRDSRIATKSLDDFLAHDWR